MRSYLPNDDFYQKVFSLFRFKGGDVGVLKTMVDGGFLGKKPVKIDSCLHVQPGFMFVPTRI